MVVIPRHVCRITESALAHEWLVRNGSGSYASASISGALTRRQHGLLVTPLAGGERTVLVAKLDEEVEVEGQLFKLGTNTYQDNVINPDGFLYLQEVALDPTCTTFCYEMGRFQLFRRVWLASDRAATYIRYTLGENSAHVRLTLIPLCDYRPAGALTHGSADWRFGVERVPRGLRVQASPEASPYWILTDPAADYTPLDLWYWRFQLRADGNASTDLFVPGLLRADLEPGASLTLVVSAGDSPPETFEQAPAIPIAAPHPLPPSDQFTGELFAAPDL